MSETATVTTTPAGGQSRVHRVTARTKPGRFLRSVWRTHFYAAIISAPILVILSLTGLVILYTEPIQGLLHHDLTRVTVGDQVRSLEDQRAAADERAPSGSHLVLVNTPRAADRATVFEYTADDAKYTDVYVNPYTARVSGTHVNGADLVGLSNRLHGFLANDSLTVPLPSLAHLIDPSSGPLIEDYVVGDLVIEIAAGWALVLALSGLYLWWPRRSQKGKALVVPRLGKRGRLRWRDAHALSGILGIATLLLFIVTGMPWSGYWGPAWSTAANKVTPAATVDAPASAVAKAGDLDRFGHRISWATREDTVPGSAPSQHQHEGGLHGRDGTASQGTTIPVGAPRRLDLDSVAAAATQEDLKPGYSINMPVDGSDADGTMLYGSYQLANYWPQQIADEQTVYLDQFSGRTLARSGPSSYGKIGEATEVGVLTHMGTQFGLVNTIGMTAGCVLLLVSIITSIAMWWIRRPKGRLGLPKRPARPRMPYALLGIATVLAVIYPLWGASAVAVVLCDWLLVRRIPRLRRGFNMPATT